MSIQATDPTFFDMVHALIEEQKQADSLGERRQSERHRYTCNQFMAPYDGKCLPTQDEFRKVACQDLSTTGFSFTSKSRPDHNLVVIALGNAPFTFFIAEILRIVPSREAGGIEYTIGCKLDNRLTRER